MYLQYLITQPCMPHSIYNTALGSQEFVCNHKVCAPERLPRFRTLISEIVLLKVHYNEGLSPLPVPQSSALLKYEQVIKRICLIFTVSPVTPNHQTAVRNEIWHEGHVPSARGL
jgi:hypothetical protein